MNGNEERIWAEMARRKVLFHPYEKWNEIKLWGLFRWNDIKNLIENGDLITDMKEENVIVWVYPSKKAWENKIKPLIKKYSIEELTEKAGW